MNASKQFQLDVIPYFPLESGMLTGKYKRGTDHPEGTRLVAPNGNPPPNAFAKQIISGTTSQ